MGNFYYIVMSFRLKNVGATYQLAITSIFYDVLHAYLKDYLNNIVVKSKEHYNHVNDEGSI